MDSASRLSVFCCSNVHSNLVRRSLCVIRPGLTRFFFCSSPSPCLRLFRSSRDLFREKTCFVNGRQSSSFFDVKERKETQKTEKFLAPHNESRALAVLHVKPLAANWLIRLWMCI